MKSLIGKVVSAKMKKTVVVEVKRPSFHSFYKKLINKRKKIKADSEGLEVKEKDTVEIGETRPKSKEKHFKVLKVLSHVAVTKRS